MNATYTPGGRRWRAPTALRHERWVASTSAGAITRERVTVTHRGSTHLLALLVCVFVLGACAGDRNGGVWLEEACEARVDSGHAVRLRGIEMRGPIRDIRELASRVTRTSVGLLTDSAFYLGRLEGDSLVIERLVAERGAGDGRVLSVDAAFEGENREITVVDKQALRITRWTPARRIASVVALHPVALADGYAAGGGRVVGVMSRPAARAYAAVTGELRTIDAAGRMDSVVGAFPSLALHVLGREQGSIMLRRPLERQPLVRWSEERGWIVASTDSLGIYFLSPPTRLPIIGNGPRVKIGDAVRDSSIEEYVRRSGATGDLKETLRQFARTELFRDRKRFQLIDDLVPLFGGRLALRRTQRCDDRQGWNVVDSLGRASSVFAVPEEYQAILPTSAGVLFMKREAAGAMLFVVKSAR